MQLWFQEVELADDKPALWVPGSLVACLAALIGVARPKSMVNRLMEL